ncbi:hypothetical protein ACLVWU_18305 [Bdellovibrio sp. HCB290]|uniref:hypothetical protein n=1 Tax=Bdellovibrio sp. HCB290 TaxID=3394356 RepID=UPI0039B452AF
MKRSKYSAGLKSNRGQAVIEYVLILVITVSLILMLITQIFKPFQAFVQSFTGDYFACLLEKGELPVLGGDNSDLECKFSFQNVSSEFKNNPSSSKSNSGDSESSSKPPKESSASSSSSSGSSGSSYAGSRSRSGGSGRISRARAPTSGIDSSSEQGGKVVEIALEGGGAGGYFKSNNGGYSVQTGRRVASVPISGLTEDERKKLEKKANGGGKTTVVQNDGFAPPKKKTAVKKPEPKLELPPEEKAVTFGNFIRWLFIAALIIALVIFLGGQALQFSKSGEK